MAYFTMAAGTLHTFIFTVQDSYTLRRTGWALEGESKLPLTVGALLTVVLSASGAARSGRLQIVLRFLWNLVHTSIPTLRSDSRETSQQGVHLTIRPVFGHARFVGLFRVLLQQAATQLQLLDKAKKIDVRTHDSVEAYLQTSGRVHVESSMATSSSSWLLLMKYLATMERWAGPGGAGAWSLAARGQT